MKESLFLSWSESELTSLLLTLPLYLKQQVHLDGLFNSRVPKTHSLFMVLIVESCLMDHHITTARNIPENFRWPCISRVTKLEFTALNNNSERLRTMDYPHRLKEIIPMLLQKIVELSQHFLLQRHLLSHKLSGPCTGLHNTQHTSSSAKNASS